MSHLSAAGKREPQSSWRVSAPPGSRHNAGMGFGNERLHFLYATLGYCQRDSARCAKFVSLGGLCSRVECNMSSTKVTGTQVPPRKRPVCDLRSPGMENTYRRLSSAGIYLGERERTCKAQPLAVGRSSVLSDPSCSSGTGRAAACSLRHAAVEGAHACSWGVKYRKLEACLGLTDAGTARQSQEKLHVPVQTARGQAGGALSSRVHCHLQA